MTELIEKFYSSFDTLDVEGMVSCYHPEVVFKDPAFGQLKGERATNMWRMLCSNQKGKEFKVTYSNVQSSGGTGSANWEAHYLFSRTNRKVHNKIYARFKFKDGLIIEHVDDFDLYNWSKQALGTSGTIFGWTGFFRKKLQRQTSGLLDRFMSANN